MSIKITNLQKHLKPSKKITGRQKKFIILYYSRVACVAISISLWMAVGIFFISPHYDQLSNGYFMTAVWFWLFCDALLTTVLKGDLFKFNAPPKIVYYVQKGWYYLDFLVGIPLFIFSIADIIKNGIGIPV